MKQRTGLPSAGLALLLALIFSVLLLTGQAQAQVTYAFTNLFSVPAGTGNIVATANDRGMAYDAASNLVYVASVGGSIGAYNGTNGAFLGDFTTTGASGGNDVFDQVGVAADGAIYVMNLSTASNSGPNKIYRYASWNSPYTTAYNYNALTNGAGIPLVSGRLGDTLAVTGAGANTLILAGVAAHTTFVLFSTTDGLNFTPTIINVPAGISGLSGDFFGLCFYTNNTFLVKPSSSGNSIVYQVQYPANFASQTVVTGTVIGSTSLGGQYNNTTFMNYAPQAGLLASVTIASSSSVALFTATNVAGGANLLINTNTSTPVAPGNSTGAVALGGKGGTNVVYWLNTGNALYAYGIVTIPPVPPTIATAPVGGSSYTTDTLSVTAAGTQPYSYFWQASSNDSATAGTFTNIPGANTNTFTVTGSTNYYQVIVTNIAGAVTSSPVQVTILKPLTNPAVTSLWTAAPGAYSFLPASGDSTRGIAYDTNSQRVVVANATSLNVLNGNTGASIEALSLTGVSYTGSLLNAGNGIDQVAIADDGAVYAGDLVNNGGALELYRWSAPSNSVTATLAFDADPGNGGAGSERWGDTLTARGSGAGTQILLGSRANASGGGTNMAFLTPNDGAGLTYQSMIIAVSNVPSGFAAGGVSFGAGNTFWAKSYNGDLFEIAFNTNTLTGAVVFDYSTGSQVPADTTGAGVDSANSILALVNLNDSPNDLQLSQLTGTPDSPVLFDQALFATANANANDNAAITIKYPRAYALNVNNGIVAVTYGVPATTPPTINTPPANVTAYTNVGSLTLSVSASGSLPLHYQWQFNSNDIAGATGSILVLTNTTASAAGYYDVVVHNIAGSITSAPALVTLITPVLSPQATPLWAIGPGTNSSANGAYLTTSGYETRGLAYDQTTSNLLVADHYYIHDYNATNGSYVGDLNTAGLPTGGVNGWTIDQIAVADDGTLYSANLSPDGTAFSIISYGQYPYTSINYAYGGSTGGNDLHTQDPVGDRWGDTMAIRGSGTSTEILFGSYDGTNVAVFATSDGVNFMPIVIPVPGVLAGFAATGIAFGPTNTFYAKGGHYFDLRQVSVDTNVWVGTVVEDYVAPPQIPNNLGGIGVDITNNILGGVCYDDTPNDVQLYLLSGNTNAPALFDQDFFPAFNANSQLNAVVTLKGGLGFALNVNNGVVAFTYSMPTAPSVTLTGVSYLPGGVTLTWNNTFDGHGYQVQYKNALTDAAWTSLGSPVTAVNATASYTDTSGTGATRFYRVISQ